MKAKVNWTGPLWVVTSSYFARTITSPESLIVKVEIRAEGPSSFLGAW
jgi:hypothetical protein